MLGIKARKVLDTKKQICAGYKIKSQKVAYFNYTGRNVTTMKFTRIDPYPEIEYKAKKEVEPKYEIFHTYHYTFDRRLKD